MLLMVVSLFLLGCANLYNAPEQPKAAAIVNGVPITEDTLEREYAALPDSYKGVVAKDAILDELIMEELLIQEAEKNGFFASKGEVDSIIMQLRELNNMTQAQFEKALIDRKTSIKQLRNSLEHQIKLARYVNETFGKQIAVSDSDIKRYYADNSEQFSAQPGQIRASHILVATIEEAENLIGMYNKGETFGSLAKAYSKDRGTAAKGGSLGFFDNATMVPEFSAAAFSLEEDQISGPVKTRFGYHIILRQPDKISLPEASPIIEKSLRMQEGEAALKIFAQQLKASSEILKWNETNGIPVKSPFRQYGKETCLKDGKPVLRVYTTTSCQQCDKGVSEFRDALPKDAFYVQILQLNTGDDLMTAEKETGIQPQELEPFTQKNPQSVVPFYDFACKYFRIGNAYVSGDEQAEFKAVLDKILAES